MGFKIRTDKYYNAVTGEPDPIISEEVFNADMQEFLNEISLDVNTKVEYDYVEGVPVETDNYDNSWTISYSLKHRKWTSWHSYLPNAYVEKPNSFYSWLNGVNGLWKHNKLGSHQNFYGTRYPYIVEYVNSSNPLTTRIFDFIRYWTEARKYFAVNESYVDQRYVTFNKAWFYNSRQFTGELNLQVKDTGEVPENYLKQQVINTNNNVIVIDRNEKDWSINDIRDIVVDYEVPMFNSTIVGRQSTYPIDKVINEAAIDVEKDWTQAEALRDKYLVVRLIFDTFDDVKLTFNFSIENEILSVR